MDLVDTLRARFPNVLVDGSPAAPGRDRWVRAKREGLKGLAAVLKTPEFGFDVLMDLFGVDYLLWEEKESRFEVVYNLYSLSRNERLFVKVAVPSEDPLVDSVASVWPAADWFEREAWDMFGIRFRGHPHLKRILMYEEFEGHPLRKDYPYNKRQPLVGPLVVFLLAFCLVLISGAHAAAQDRTSRLVQQGDQAYFKGDMKKSTELYEQAVRENPGDAAALLSLGVNYAEQGLWEKAIAHLEKARALNPRNSEPCINLSLVYGEQGRFKEAVALAEKAVELDPKRPGAYHALGLAHEGAGNIDKAIQAYQRSLKIEPKNADIHVTLGNLYARQKKPDEAVRSYEKSLEINPKGVFAYSNIGYIYQEKGDWPKALEYFERATQAAPRDETAWYDLGTAYSKQDDYEKAIECFEKSFGLNPKSYKACLSLALAYEGAGKLERSAEHYTKALSLTDNPKLKEAILKALTRSSEPTEQ